MVPSRGQSCRFHSLVSLGLFCSCAALRNEAGQGQRAVRSWSASTTASSERSWTRLPANWQRAGDRPTDPTSRCSVPGPRSGRRCSRQSAVGRKRLSQVTRELVAPSPYFPPIHSGLSAYLPPIGRTEVRKSLQTLAAPVRPCPWLTRRIPCTGLGFPVVTGASNQSPTMGDTGLELASGAQVRPDSLVLVGFSVLGSAQVRSNCYQARAIRGAGDDRSRASCSSEAAAGLRTASRLVAAEQRGVAGWLAPPAMRVVRISDVALPVAGLRGGRRRRSRLGGLRRSRR